MDNLKIKCRSCGKELEGHSGRSYSCGCPNMTSIFDEKITAKDLSKVLIVSSGIKKDKKNSLTDSELQWQEQRRMRKVRRLDFEIR